MNDDDKHFVPIGKHLAHIEGDSIHFVSRGVLNLEELKMLMEHYGRIRREYGCLFVLFDSRGSGGMDRETRRFDPGPDREPYIADLQVAFGGSFTLRVALTMMNRANQLLGRRTAPIQMFETEKQAREYFDKERAKVRQRVGKK